MHLSIAHSGHALVVIARKVHLPSRDSAQIAALGNTLARGGVSKIKNARAKRRIKTHGLLQFNTACCFGIGVNFARNQQKLVKINTNPEK